MQPKQISSWITSKEFHNESIGTHVKSWLTETGPITNRIKSNGTFKLELIKDEVGTVKRIDANFLGEDLGEIKIREVLLLSNDKPKVFARSLIPIKTIEKLKLTANQKVISWSLFLVSSRKVMHLPSIFLKINYDRFKRRSFASDVHIL